MNLRKDLVLRKVGKDYIIVDPGQDMVDMSTIFTLNETSAWLWEELRETSFSKEDMVALLLDRYEVTREKAEADCTALLEQFEAHHLLES